jgi:hypothetical protein
MTRLLTSTPASSALRAAAPLMLRRTCACGTHTAGAQCDECAKTDTLLQRRSVDDRGDTHAPDSVHRVLADTGRPLDASTRNSMQALLGRFFSHKSAGVPARAATPAARLEIGPSGDAFEREAEAAADHVGRSGPQAGTPREGGAPVDFSAVRVHDGAAAAASARDVGALAYTVGDKIVFGTGRYAPASSDGRRLLAHELAHVVQQCAAGGSAPLRRDTGAAVQGPPADQPAPPTRVGMSVSLAGLNFEVPDDVRLKAGRRTPQLLAIVLQRLLGAPPAPALVEEVERALAKQAFERFGGFKDQQLAKGGEPVNRITLLLEPTVVLLDALKAKGLKTVLSPEQEDLLQLGFASRDLWVNFNATLKESGLPLPHWYTRVIFEREMAQHGALLKQYLGQLKIGTEARLASRSTVADVIGALYGPAMVLEAVRLDTALATNEKTRAAYAMLWTLPTPPKGQPLVVSQAPTKLRNEGMAVLFLGYMRTQGKLALNAEFYADQRALLVERFGRFASSMMFQPVGAGADETVRDQPATSNRPAFPSNLHGMPEQPPPFFNAALGTDHRFGMEVEFPSVYEALGRYLFNWERVRVPNDKLGKPVDVEKLKGEQVSVGEIATVRFDRDTAYAAADIHKFVDEMRSDLGPAGIGALELVGANAILRYIGTGIRLGIDLLTMPNDQKLVTFPSPGLYIVRAAMSQVREGSEEIMRAPSVAYFPVLAREPDEMATAGVNAAVMAREKTQQRIKALEAQLAGPIDAAERPALQQQLDALRAALAPMSARLAARRADADKLVKEIEAGRQEGDLDAATRERTNLDKIIALRGKRPVGDKAEPLTARFVSDLGQSLALQLEVVDKTAPDAKGPARVYVSDITTPKSGDQEGSGKTRDDAIADAVKQLLESMHGYGRGRVALALSGGVRKIRIEASAGSLLVEAVESVATALSVAALAAAPFTGGATLVFLVPLGLVGAIPSAYRVIKRLEAGTFEFDLENAMDLVNIAASVIGIGRIGATSLRSVRMGRALLVVGFGVDAAGGVLMGAQLLQQIDALAKLPPGERSAALLLLMGQTLMSAGVMAGGTLAERAQQVHAEVKAGTLAEPHATPKTGGVGEPGAAAPKSGEPGPAHGAPAERPPGGVGEPAVKPVDLAEVANRFDRARVDTEMSKLGRMDADSEARLRADEPLRKALADQPRAASALKKCASPCYPPGVTERQVQRLDTLLSRLAETGGYDEAALKEYLHARRGNLDAAITQLEGTKTAGDLNAWLKYYNSGREPTRLPPKGDPADLLAVRDRAHDIGVAKGREAAYGDNLKDAGFKNPFERQGRYGQGFDDIMRTGSTLDNGDIYIVEYKGGGAVLAEGQMSLEWVLDNIRRLHATGDPADQAFARSLSKALREGRLKGVVFYTGLEGNAPKPTHRVDHGVYKLGGTKVGF